jgi:hypothetical protein
VIVPPELFSLPMLSPPYRSLAGEEVRCGWVGVDINVNLW